MSTFPLPAVEKTWQFDVNNVVSVGSAQGLHRTWIMRAVTALVNFGSSPWTVVGSSSGPGGSAALDGVNRWSGSPGNIQPGAWIVLQQDGISSGFQLCWQNTLEFPADFRNEMTVSPSAGFTGGGLTTRPTATDEVVITTVATTDITSNTNDITVNVVQSDDGECTRIWTYQNSGNPHFTIIDRLQRPVSGFSIPWLGWSNNRFIGAATAAAHYTDAFGTTGQRGRQSSTVLTFSLASAATVDGAGGVVFPGNSTTYGSGINSYSSEYLMAPITVACRTASNLGLHGELADIWAGSNLISQGDTYPDTGTQDQFVQVGSLILPWNGTVPSGVTSTRRKGRAVWGHQGNVP
jgi:hypothetical protein